MKDELGNEVKGDDIVLRLRCRNFGKGNLENQAADEIVRLRRLIRKQDRVRVPAG